MNVIKKNYQGLLLCLLIGIIIGLLGKNSSIIGSSVFAILLGLIIAPFPRKNYFQSGITFTSKKYSNMQLLLLHQLLMLMMRILQKKDHVFLVMAIL